MFGTDVFMVQAACLVLRGVHHVLALGSEKWKSGALSHLLVERLDSPQSVFVPISE